VTLACASTIVRAWYDVFSRRQAPEAAAAAGAAFLVEAAAAFGADEGLRLALAAVIASPYTMFRWEEGRGRAVHRGREVRALDADELASALAFAISDRPPTATFVADLQRVDLASAAAVEPVVRQHLVANKNGQAIRGFLREMFRIGPINAADAADPSFKQATADQLLTEVDVWLEDHVGRGEANLRGLLSSDAVFASNETAGIWGVPKTGLAVAAKRAASAPPGQRVGLLTHPAFLASHAFAGSGDPVHRGKVVRDNLLCASLPPPPPEAANIVIPDDPNLSNRARFVEHGRSPACSVCHRLLDEIGFALESYDGAGRFRTEYRNKSPIDATGNLHDTDVDGPVEAAAGLVDRLLASAQVRACLGTHVFRFATGDVPRQGDACSLAELNGALTPQTDVVSAVVQAVLSPAFRLRQ
jgi:hypothetical protein